MDDTRPGKEAGEAAKRRIGVSAETGADTGTNEPTPVYPKSQDEQKRIGAILSKLILFSAVTSDQLEELISAFFSVEKKAGETIIKVGEQGDNFYIVDEGEADVYLALGGGEPKIVKTVTAGGFFGELALMYSQPRAATIKAKTKCMLWALDRVTFRRILVAASTEQARQTQAFLDKVKILDPLTAKEKADLADAMVETRVYNDGEYIIKQGDRGDSFYIISEGNARIAKAAKAKGKEKDIATIGKGDYFGEVAILSDQPRQASVIAKGKVKCLSLDRDTFTRLLGPAEQILKQKMNEYKDGPAK